MIFVLRDSDSLDVSAIITTEDPRVTNFRTSLTMSKRNGTKKNTPTIYSQRLLKHCQTSTKYMLEWTVILTRFGIKEV